MFVHTCTAVVFHVDFEMSNPLINGQSLIANKIPQWGRFPNSFETMVFRNDGIDVVVFGLCSSTSYDFQQTCVTGYLFRKAINKCCIHLTVTSISYNLTNCHVTHLCARYLGHICHFMQIYPYISFNIANRHPGMLYPDSGQYFLGVVNRHVAPCPKKKVKTIR